MLLFPEAIFLSTLFSPYLYSDPHTCVARPNAHHIGCAVHPVEQKYPLRPNAPVS